MRRVLIVEDESDIREVLAYNLGLAGHEAHVAASGNDGLRLARELKPDLVLLDLMLPDLSGSSVCRTLRADPSLREMRIMMVTAKGEEIDRVVGFELGVDDYVTKPFSVRELMLRVNALLRRSAPQATAWAEHGELRVDRAAYRVTVAGTEVHLTTLEFKLLITLLDRRNRVQTRAMLLADVWDLDADLESRTVDTHVKRLREKLGSAGEYIETVRGVGYRMADAPS